MHSVSCFSIKCNQRILIKHNRIDKLKETALHMSYENKSAFKVSSLPAILLGVFGVFGFGLFDMAKDLTKEINTDSKVKLKNSSNQLNDNKSEGTRGSMTRLTKREINAKLQQVPVFFIGSSEKQGVYVDADKSTGYIFIDQKDAEEYLKSIDNSSSNYKIFASTLDTFYYTLLTKQAKLGTYIGGIVGSSDPAATYLLRAPHKQIDNMPSEWKDSHPDDLPLFRIANLAFNRDTGLEIPLFCTKEDAAYSYERLLELKKNDRGASSSSASSSPSSLSSSLPATPTYQYLGLKDLIGIWSTGGFEGRALEIYPSMDNIDMASKLLI